MSLSRRHFITSTGLSAATIPLLMGANIDYCEAASGSNYDLSMGNPKGAIQLNFNENTLGPSPKAIAGAKAGLQEAYRYALGGLLRPLLSDYHKIDKDWILLGTGSTELQRLAPVAHLRAGDNVVSSLETWGGLIAVAEHIGATVKRVPLLKAQNYAYDVDGLLAAVDAKTRIFLMVTPNNPTGAVLAYSDMKKIADALPKEVLFVIDEAYADYHPDGWKTGLDLLREGYKNVLVTRTFSKAHALAGLRCGYGLAHPDILSKISRYGCGPASTNIVVFGAVQGALDDLAHVKRSRDYVQKTRAYYEQQCQQLELQSLAGPSPFMLINLGKRSEAIHSELKQRKILVGHGKSWHMPDFLRVSYGREKENQAFFKALKTLL